jgi:hypothetical protein
MITPLLSPAPVLSPASCPCAPVQYCWFFVITFAFTWILIIFGRCGRGGGAGPHAPHAPHAPYLQRWCCFWTCASAACEHP